MNDSPNPYPDTVSDLLWEKASTKEREWIRQHEEQHKRAAAASNRRTASAAQDKSTLGEITVVDLSPPIKPSPAI